MMTHKPYVYVIRVQGHLTEQWSDWFEGLVIQADPDGTTLLRGLLPDQAALIGLLTKVHALNLTLLSMNRLYPEE
jgi:hypothetical protein